MVTGLNSLEFKQRIYEAYRDAVYNNRYVYLLKNGDTSFTCPKNINEINEVFAEISLQDVKRVKDYAEKNNISIGEAIEVIAYDVWFTCTRN